MQLADVKLDDKYTLESGRVYLNGIQALTRLLIMQRVRDAAAGLNTAGFVSGFQGSPLNNMDKTLWEAHDLLQQHHIHFQPGQNEELAVMGVWGSQQVTLDPHARYQGVFGMWYGKWAGLARSRRRAAPRQFGGRGAARRRAAGLRRRSHGDVFHGRDAERDDADVADDSGAGAHRRAGVPGPRRARLRDVALLGLVARVQGARRHRSSARRRSASIPRASAFACPRISRCRRAGSGLRLPDQPLSMERRIHEQRLPAVLAYARANRLNYVAYDSPRARLGIVAAGKSYLDVRQALEHLGIDEQRGRAHRHPRLQARPHLAARAAGTACVRAGARGDPGRRGKAPDHRGPDPHAALPLARCAAAAHRRQARRGKRSQRMAAAAARRTQRRTGRARDRGAPASASTRGARIEERAAWLRAKEEALAKPSLSPQLRGYLSDAGPRSLFLLRLPAQQLDARARRQRGDRRRRLPLHGDLHLLRHQDLLADGLGRRRVGRTCAVHRHHAHLRQHGRRNLLPLGPARDPRRRGGQRRHHLQDPLQRRDRRDRRPAAADSAQCARPHPPARGGRRGAHRRRHRPAREVRQGRTRSPRASRYAIAITSTPCSASCAKWAASRRSSTTRPARRRSGGAASAASFPIPRAARSSTRASAKVAATAAPNRTAFR